MKIEMSKYRTVSFILMILILAQATFAQTINQQSIDDYVNKAIKDWEVPGVAIAVVKDDKIVFAKGYGVKELGKPDAVTENTVFAIGSASKAFTAASLAILADEGKLKFDDPAAKYLPDFQLFDPYATRELSVTDLLSHRVGLERGDRLWYATAYDRNEVMRRIRFLKPSSSFRSKFGYQNIMFLAAGQIIPVVAGKSWDDFVKERIFAPLGMTSSSTSITSFSNVKDLATPHAKIDDKVKPIKYRLIDNIGPAGSINSNVLDMAQWMRMQLGGGKYGDKQIVSAANIKLMHSPQTIIPLEGLYTTIYSEAHFFSYGMGWFLSDLRGRKMVEHGGAIDGMRAAVSMIPEEKLGVVVLGNMNGSISVQMIANRILDAYLAPGKEKDWSADALKVMKAAEEQAKVAAKKREDERAKNTNPSLALEKYAGDYSDQMYGDAKVAFENGKLRANFGPNFRGTLEHWHFDTFRVKWDDEVAGQSFINFKLNSQGKVDMMSMEGLADFKRQPDKPATTASK